MSLSRAEMEERRLAATSLFRAGWYAAEVARALGVSRTSAGRWRIAWEQGGSKALVSHRSSGRPRRIDREQIRKLWKRHGWPRMTTGDLAALIETHLGVRYHRDHVQRIMADLSIPRRSAGAEA